MAKQKQVSISISKIFLAIVVLIVLYVGYIFLLNWQSGGVANIVLPTSTPMATSESTQTQMGFSFTLPTDFKILSQSAAKIVVGTDDTVQTPYLTFSRKSTLKLNTLMYCSEKGTYPCLYVGSLMGQQESIHDTNVGGRVAKSFYINTGGRGTAEHVIQVENEFEARMKVSDDALDKAFQNMMRSVVFDK